MVKHLTQCPKSLQNKKNAPSRYGVDVFLVVGRGMFIWHAREGYGGANAVQSPKLVDWGLTKDSRHLSSYQMTHVLKNIANQWQILVHFSSFAMSI